MFKFIIYNVLRLFLCEMHAECSFKNNGMIDNNKYIDCVYLIWISLYILRDFVFGIRIKLATYSNLNKNYYYFY